MARLPPQASSARSGRRFPSPPRRLTHRSRYLVDSVQLPHRGGFGDLSHTIERLARDRTSGANPALTTGHRLRRAGLLSPLLTSDGSATPSDAPSSLLSDHAVRPPRRKTSHLPAYARRIYTSALSVQVPDFESLAPSHPTRLPHMRFLFVSGQRFVSSFLQIPPRDGHPCLQLTVPPAGPVEDLACSAHAAPPGESPCRAQTQKKAVGEDLRRPERNESGCRPLSCEW